MGSPGWALCALSLVGCSDGGLELPDEARWSARVDAYPHELAVIQGTPVLLSSPDRYPNSMKVTGFSEVTGDELWTAPFEGRTRLLGTDETGQLLVSSGDRQISVLSRDGTARSEDWRDAGIDATFDASGGLVAFLSCLGARCAVGVNRFSDRSVVWSAVFDVAPINSTMYRIADLASDGDLLVGLLSGPARRLMRFSRDGQLAWSDAITPFAKYLPDGDILVQDIQTDSSPISRLGRDRTVRWTIGPDQATFTPTEIVGTVVGDGRVYLHKHPLFTESQATLVEIDPQTGALLRTFEFSESVWGAVPGPILYVGLGHCPTEGDECRAYTDLVAMDVN